MAIFGIKPTDTDDMKYQIVNPDAVALKKHFK
jgi:hypothetical protein